MLKVLSVSADPSLTFPESTRDVSRIVSGWEAERGQLPFQLSIRMVNPNGSVNSCGGSIIHQEWGITAAHCTATRTTIVIRAGAVNLTQPFYIFETTEYYNHPLYNEALQQVVQPNDIGLLKFGRALIFNDYVQPIRLQNSESKNRDYHGIRLTASGWGRTWTQGLAPENLNWVYLLGTSNIDCLIAFGGSSIIQDSTICASSYNVTSQSTCQGDSGGPLTVIDYDGQLSEVGVTSFVSATGCHTGFPAGFIRPGHYHDWYYEVTGINFDWVFNPLTTTTEVLETTTEVLETTTEVLETTTEVLETTTEVLETTTEVLETTTEVLETTTEVLETTTEVLETTTEILETTTEVLETTTEVLDITTDIDYCTSEGLETTTEVLETTTPVPEVEIE
ncbi:collagenase-like [Achroia grisella]|uniref:collagenase-like n=1 Tax=Achroia grisella TaxID=688607 RepID=UPI0027D26022|nr:collagenase-like [Achroia grisella]